MNNMKAQTFAFIISAFIICSLFYGYYSTQSSPVIQDRDNTIVELQKENRQQAKIISKREYIEYKKIELDYLWPIHLEDWIPGPSELTSAFGERDDSEAGGLSDGYHEGDDMWGVFHSGEYGKETWLARITVITDGWVEHFLNDPVKGEWYLLHHDDGNESEYHHVSKGYILDGERVYQGQVIARMGNTGISTGPHLHFQLTISGKLVNPLKYIEIPKE